MTGIFTIAQQRDIRHLAGCLLQAQIALTGPPAERPADTGDLILSGLRGLTARYGTPGLALATREWCDALSAALPSDSPLPEFAGEESPPAPQWAGDLLTAHLTRDQVMIYRLMGALPPEPLEYVLHLLALVAVSISVLHEPTSAVLDRAS